MEHDLSDAEKRRECGCQLTRIGEEVSEQLDIIPAKIQVIRNIRIKYACKDCEATVRTAPLPPLPIPKSNATPGLLSHIVVGKYQDALPLARQEKQSIREERAAPLLEGLHTWALKSIDEVPPSSLTGKALHYLLEQWPKLIRYLEDGRLSIDNNATERAIRPFVIGRRNRLFADTQRGAIASANLYSLIEPPRPTTLSLMSTCVTFLKNCPAAHTVEQLEAMLPFNLDRQL